jgi:hypothetical protein
LAFEAGMSRTGGKNLAISASHKDKIGIAKNETTKTMNEPRPLFQQITTAIPKQTTSRSQR